MLSRFRYFWLFVFGLLLPSVSYAQTYAGDPEDTAAFFTVPFYDMMSKVLPLLMGILLAIYVWRVFKRTAGAKGGKI